MNNPGVLDNPPAGKPGDNKLTPAIQREPLHSLKKKLPLRVLTPADFEHWQTYGFVVIPQAVPAENVAALKAPAMGISGDGPRRHLHLERGAAAQSRHERTQQQRHGRDL